MADDTLFTLLNRAQHLLMKEANRKCWEKLDMSVAQLGALLYLRRHDGCRHKELSAALSLNNSAITGLVTRMEGRRLVERRPCEDDRRASRLYLTDKAHTQLELAYPLLRQFNEALIEGFDERDIAAVTRFLYGIIDRTSQEDAE